MPFFLYSRASVSFLVRLWFCCIPELFLLVLLYLGYCVPGLSPFGSSGPGSLIWFSCIPELFLLVLLYLGYCVPGLSPFGSSNPGSLIWFSYIPELFLLVLLYLGYCVPGLSPFGSSGPGSLIFPGYSPLLLWALAFIICAIPFYYIKPYLGHSFQLFILFKKKGIKNIHQCKVLFISQSHVKTT